MASASIPAGPQPGDDLPRTTDQIKQSCKRFRVLVLGKEGVGKSSLINQIFKVDIAKVSEYTAGEADIDREIFSEENDSFVLHDSRGYGSGETENFRKLTDFIAHRTGNDNVGDRLHAIWLCIATPFAGGRVVEAGDEEIFRVVHGKVPIIVVFTRYDYLVNAKEYDLRKSGIQKTEDEIQSLAKSNADQSFEKDCIVPMKKVNSSIPYVRVSVKPRYEDTLRNLVKTTLHHINPAEYPSLHVDPTHQPKPSKRLSRFQSLFSSKTSKKAVCEPINIDTADPVGVMFAMAQRIDLDANIRASVSVGHKKYWRGLASGANFIGKDLKQCLEVVHDDIVAIWNFPSLSMLRHDGFRGRISQLVASLADSQDSSPNDRIIQNTTSIAGAAGAISVIAAGTANPVGFIVGPIVAGVVFAKWVYDVYRATPAVLRCFMAYIVDLIIIMQMIFVISEARPDGVVKPEEVEDVLNRFEANQCNDVHHEIRRFAREMGVLKAVTGKDIVFDKIVNLIDQYRARGEDSTRAEMPA